MASLRGVLLAACCGGLFLMNSAEATEPPSTRISTDAEEMTARSAHTRQRILERAQQESQARAARMAARKRAGISLQRPLRTTPWQTAMSPYERINRGVRIVR